MSTENFEDPIDEMELKLKVKDIAKSAKILEAAKKREKMTIHVLLIVAVSFVFIALGFTKSIEMPNYLNFLFLFQFIMIYVLSLGEATNRRIDALVQLIEAGIGESDKKNA